MQAGVQWSHDIAGGRVSVSPMFTYGTVEANLHANTSSSRGHPWALGLNANYVTDGGIYVDATYQHMSMDVDLKTPGTATGAKGDTKIKGQGFNLEAGYSHKLKNGLTIEPQLQLTHTKVDMDDFSSSDDIYQLSDIDGKSTTLRAGVSVYKVFETDNGSITPLASLSYINALKGKTQLASNGVDFDSDTSGAGYKAEIGLLGRYHAWDFAGKLAVSNTSATGSILQPSFTARYAIGGAGKALAKTAAAQQLPEVTEATVKFAEAGSAQMGPLATAAPAEEGARVVSAAYAQTGAEPAEDKEKKEEQPQQASPELNPEPAAENPMNAPDSEPAADEVADDITDITVTGTLIRRSTATEATPITVVTSEDMAERGLMTLGEVMQSFTQNEGFVQGKASNLLGRFTFGAEEINFRGLGAGRTLVLVNGRRIADYPLPFGGEQNGVDLGTIPYSAIAKVEYLSAGASATYGSDAVGGVVNIITKRDMEQTSLELTGGLYQQGFGETGRVSFITGNSFDKGSFTVGVEGYYSGEILASDAKYFRKHAPYTAGMITIDENSATGTTSVVPESACAPLGFEFDSGACTSNVSDTISLNPKTKQGSFFFDGRYDLTDRIELFGTAMASIGKVENRSNVLFWQGVVVDAGPDGVIGDENFSDDGNAMFIQRGFSEDELGVSKITVDNNMWTVVAGAKGAIDVGDGAWYWDVAASHASFHTKQTSMNLKEEGVRNWLLDGAATALDFSGQRYTYFVDQGFYNSQLIDNIVRPVQPNDVDSLVGKNIMKANSSAQSLTATLNGTIGDLGFLFKPVKFAVRAEYGRQVTEINPDERTLNTTGEGWFNIGAIEAKGTRNRWALAAEADTSVLSNLDLVLGVRYDHYDDDSSITGRFTSQAKFLYRPTDWLKVRGGYGQTFRAPDMFNIYGRSDGFEIVPDFSAPGCFDGSTYTCGGYQIASTRQADPNLKEEHGDDLGLGVIVNPLPGFQFTVDWYKIHLKDLVLTESSYDLILKEWQCANGVLDASSALCADVNNRVIRNEIDGLERVIVQPINSSDLTRSGFDIQASYSFESAKLGSFNFNLGYSRVLKFDLTRFKGDDALDLKYGEPGAATPGNNLNFGLNWYQPLTTGKGIAAGLFVQRTGRVYNFDQSQFLEPFYDVNLSAAYQLNTKTSFRLNINNLLNTKPQENGSGFWPGYWAQLQTANALGRSAYVSLNYSFN
jgi:outer membrane receptor protein involved in Fe transport